MDGEDLFIILLVIGIAALVFFNIWGFILVIKWLFSDYAAQSIWEKIAVWSYSPYVGVAMYKSQS